MQKDGTYKPFLVTYELTEQEKENIYSGIDVDITDKYKIEEIKDTGLELKMSAYCIYIYVEHCYCDEHNSETGYFGCDCYEILSTSSYCVSSGGGIDYQSHNPEEGDTDGTDASCSTCGSNGEQTGGTETEDDTKDTTGFTTDDPYAVDRKKGFIRFQLSSDQLALFNILSPELQEQIISYLENQVGDDVTTQQYPEDAAIFAIQAINALQDNNNDGQPDNEVDFINAIIIADSMVGTDVECILNILLDNSSGNNFFNNMIDYFDIIDSPIKFSLGTSTDTNEYAFTKGETVNFGNLSSTTFEIVSDTEKMNSSSNLLKMVTLSHEVIHAHMFLQLQASNYLYFDSNGEPRFTESLSCDGFQIIPGINLNTYSIRERWKYLICEFLINNPNNSQLTNDLFNTASFAIGESYRTNLEELILSKHDWNNEPQSLKDLMQQWYGDNWKEKISSYISWFGLEDTPQFSDWLSSEGISFSDWNIVIAPFINADWVEENDVNHNCN